MEMKVGKHIQSSFSKCKNNADPVAATAVSAKAKSTNSSMKADTFSLSASSYAATQRTNTDTFTKSSPSSGNNVFLSGIDMSGEMREQLRMFNENIKNLEVWEPLHISGYEENAKFNFDIIRYSEKCLNEAVSKRLEEAGVPKDVTFEFDFKFDSDFDFASITIEVTEISDEKYRESVEEVLAGSKGPLTVISYASRVMNGYISSLYYPCISKALDRCFGQDINDLYIDEKGNLCGVNEDLRAAINAEKKATANGEHFYVMREFGFPAENIEALVKQLVSEENITPNISHIGYDGECIYTNDGEFKFGKDFDPSLFDEGKYVMRGTSAFLMTFYSHIDLWLKNYEKFY